MHLSQVGKVQQRKQVRNMYIARTPPRRKRETTRCNLQEGPSHKVSSDVGESVFKERPKIQKSGNSEGKPKAKTQERTRTSDKTGYLPNETTGAKS